MSADAATMSGVRGTPVALSIAGSDSGGGAGIQADLKAFARCGVHGTCAITAITAQSTVGVDAIHSVPPEIVLAQVHAVVADIGVNAVKVGMLGTAAVTHAVARALDELPAGTPVVVDPVMVSESGAQLLDEDARQTLIAEILPRATVLTPNLPEARMLAGQGGAVPDAPADDLDASGQEECDEDQKNDVLRARARTRAAPTFGIHDDASTLRQLVQAVLALGPQTIVLTGGHRRRAVDLFLDGSGKIVEIAGERHPDGAAHGSGCTHSSVLAAQLALGRTPLEAARIARSLAGEAVAGGLRDLGAGPGPVDVIGLAAMRSRGTRPRPA